MWLHPRNVGIRVTKGSRDLRVGCCPTNGWYAVGTHKLMNRSAIIMEHKQNFDRVQNCPVLANCVFRQSTNLEISYLWACGTRIIGVKGPPGDADWKPREINHSNLWVISSVCGHKTEHTEPKCMVSWLKLFNKLNKNQNSSVILN